MSRPLEQMTEEDLRAEVARLRTMRQLVWSAIKPSLDPANAFGGEMRLAIAVRDVIERRGDAQ